MKLLFVAPSFGKGGAERVISILSDKLSERGHDVCLAVFNTVRPPLAYDLNPKVKVVYVTSHRFTKPKQIKASLGALAACFRDEKPDVVLSFTNVVGAQCAIACKRMKIPFVFSERNDPRMLLRGTKARLFQKLLLLNLRYAVFQTTGAKNIYPKRVRKRSVVILNPISDKMPPAYEGERKKEIITVGRLEKQKRQDLLIRAFSLIAPQHPDYCLKLYGEGTLRPQLAALIDELGLGERVFLMGNRDDVFSYMQDAEIFAFTSDYEGIPNALIEAMVLGLPCVSTRCSPGGAEELIVHEENGLLTPCGDVEAFAAGMERLLSDPALRDALGKQATHLRARVQVEQIVDEWEQYLQKVVNYAK